MMYVTKRSLSRYSWFAVPDPFWTRFTFKYSPTGKCEANYAASSLNFHSMLEGDLSSGNGPGEAEN
jgi:hypothetical protein